MRSLKQFTVIVILLLLAACGGGGGNSYVPNPGGGSDNNPPISDSNKLALSDLQVTCPVEDGVVGGKSASITTNAAQLDGLQSIAISVDGENISTGKASCLWNTTDMSNGAHIVKVDVQTSHGNATDTVAVKVDNKVPRFAGGHIPSSVGQVTIDSVNPSSVPWGYAGEVEVYGSGFYSLDPENVCVFLLPQQIDSLRGMYAPWWGLEVVSDTLLTLDMSAYQQPAEDSNPVGWYTVAVGDIQGGSSMVVDALLEEGLYVEATAASPTVSSIMPTTLFTGGSEDIVVDIFGENIPDTNHYIVRLDKQDRVEVGDDLFDANWGMDSSQVEKVGSSNHLRATFDATVWGEWITPGTYILTVSCHDQVGVWSPKADRYPVFVKSEGDLLPPLVTASAVPTSGDSPLSVQFSGSAQAQNEGSEIADIWWDFDGDGYIDSHEQNPTYTYILPEGVSEKQYLVTFGATDSFGCFNAFYLQVDVHQPGSNLEPPAVEARANPTQGESPLFVQFEAVAYSSNNGGSIVSYQWDFNRDGVWDSSDMNPSHTFTLPISETSHIYNVKLGVTDSFGMYAEDTVSVTVTEGASELSSPYFTSLEYNPYPAITGDPEGVQVTFAADTVLPNAGSSIAHVIWDFDGDGTYDEDSGASLVVDHYYQRPSTAYQDFLVTVKVIDTFGMTGMESIWVSIRQGHNPYVYFTYSRDSQVSPTTVTFTSQAVALNGQNIVSYEWDLNGDGEVDATGPSVQYVYTVPNGQSRTWYVLHWARDGLGRSDYYVEGITVQGQRSLQVPYVRIEPKNVSGQAPLRVDFTTSAGVYNGGSVSQIRWYCNDVWVQDGWSWSNTFNSDACVRVLLVDTNGLTATDYASVDVSSVSQGDEDEDPDLPPIIIQGDNGDDEYNPDDAGVGDGAPNGTVRQAFKDAYNRAQGNAGRPTTNVYRLGSGYVQDLYGGAAGAGAIMMKDGQSQAAWIHGDIYHKYISLGGPSSYLGFPLQDEAAGSTSSFGTQSAYTLFSGDNYAQAQLVYHKGGSYQYQVYEVRGAIYNKWKSLGGNGSSLGLPTSDQYQWNGGWRSDFEGGYVFCSSSGQTSVNGTGGGGGGGNGAQLIQQKRNQISPSQIGSALTNVLSADWGGYGTFDYQVFAGGSGWIGILVYNHSKNEVYYVQGAICKFWWDGSINGVQCEGIGREMGLPVSDEYAWNGKRRSDLDLGYVVWDSGTDLCSPYRYNGEGWYNSPTLNTGALFWLLFDWAIADHNCFTAQAADNFTACVVEYGTIVLSANPVARRVTVKVIQEGLEKAVENSDLVRKIIKTERGIPDEEVLDVMLREAGEQGMPELPNLRRMVTELSSKERARLMVLAGDPVRCRNLDLYLAVKGDYGIDLIKSMIRITPDNLADLLSSVVTPGSIASILQTGGYEATQTGFDWMASTAISQGKIYFGWLYGSSARRVFIHHGNALIEIADAGGRGQIVKVVQTWNPDSYLTTSNGYLDCVRIR